MRSGTEGFVSILPIRSSSGILDFFEDAGLSQQLAQFLTFNTPLDDFSSGVPRHDTDLKLLWAGSRHIHRFSEDLGREDRRLLQVQVFGVIILESAHSVHTVFASGVGFPGSIIA